MELSPEEEAAEKLVIEDRPQDAESISSSQSAPALLIPQRHCASGKCGRCWRCLDNARWERIFNEKFADPDYYTATATRNGSSLSWLR
jgi:hypothetical protein